MAFTNWCLSRFDSFKLPEAWNTTEVMELDSAYTFIDFRFLAPEEKTYSADIAAVIGKESQSGAVATMLNSYSPSSALNFVLQGTRCTLVQPLVNVLPEASNVKPSVSLSEGRIKILFTRCTAFSML